MLPQIVNFGNKLGEEMSDWEIAKAFKRCNEFSAGVHGQLSMQIRMDWKRIPSSF